MNRKTQAIMDLMATRRLVREAAPVVEEEKDVIVYYIGWKGAINNKQQGEVDLAGGIMGKRFALRILKEMRKVYTRGTVTLHTQPLHERMEA